MLPLTVLGAHRLRYVCTIDASVHLDGLGFSIIYKESRDNCLRQVSVRQPSGPSILRAWFNCLKLRYVLPFEMLWHIWDIRYERQGLRNPLSSERSAQESTDWTGCTHVVIRIKPCVPVAQQLSSCFSVLYGVPLLRTPVYSVHSRPFLFLFSPGPFCCQEKMAPLAGPSLAPSACGTCHVHPHVPNTDQFP